MEIKSIIKSEIISFLNEDRRDYLRWKRKNVTLRGLREANQTENGGMAMLGSGLYTAYLGNRELARKYGKVYFVLNAIPKKPIVFNTLNDWEIWSYNTLIVNWCKQHGFEPSRNIFYEHTNLRDEIMKLGYDGVAIKGREMVNYDPPENIIYFENEYQLENYYEHAIEGSLNEIINEEYSNGVLYGYHATKCDNITNIKYLGFKIGDRQMQGRGIYGFYNLTDNSSGGAAVGYGSRHVDNNNFCVVQFKITETNKILILDKDIAYDVKGQRGDIITQIEDIFGTFETYWLKIEARLKPEYRTDEFKLELKEEIQKDFDNKNSKELMFGTPNLEHLSQYGIIFDGEYGMEYLIKQPKLMQPTGYYEIKRENYKLQIGEFQKFDESLNENIKKNFKYSLNKDEDRTTLTATLNNIKIGSVTTEILFDAYYEFNDVLSEDEFYEMFPDDNIVKIEHIEVDDNYKSQGIATKLMEMIMTHMKKQGYTQFYLNASPMGFSGLSLSNLVDFYEKFGFKSFLNQGNNVLMYYNI